MVKRVLLTGGPYAGKTTVFDSLRMEYVNKPVIFVPESATFLLNMGVPSPKSERITVQQFEELVLWTQVELDALLHHIKYYCPPKVIVYDRCALDGVAYWPKGKEDFLRLFCNWEMSLSKYDIVFYFQTQAYYAYEPTHTRFHSREEAIAICQQLEEFYQQHFNFVKLPYWYSLDRKYDTVSHAISSYLGGDNL